MTSQPKKHHIQYMVDNHNTLPLSRIKDGLENLRLFWTKNRIRKWLREKGLDWIEDTPPPTTPKPYSKTYSDKKKKEEDEVIEKVLKTHYPEGGAKVVKEILSKSAIYRTTPQISHLARRFEVKRDRSKKPLQKHKSRINQHLQKAYYTIEDFNERYGTNFTIFAKDSNKGEVLDSYISIERGERMVLDLVGRLFKDGYTLKKGGANSFYIWGGE